MFPLLSHWTMEQEGRSPPQAPESILAGAGAALTRCAGLGVGVAMVTSTGYTRAIVVTSLGRSGAASTVGMGTFWPKRTITAAMDTWRVCTRV